MAETAEELKKDVSDVLEQFKNVMSSIVQELGRKSHDVFGKVAEDGKKSFSDMAQNASQEVDNVTKDLKDSVKDFGDKAFGQQFMGFAKTGLEMVRSLFSGADIKVGVNFGQVEGDAGKAVEAAKAAFHDLSAINVAGALLEPLGDVLMKLGEPVDSLMRKFTNLEGGAAGLFSAFDGAGKAGLAGMAGLDGQLVSFRQTLTETALATGMSVAKLKEEFEALGQAGIDPTKLNDMKTIAIGADGATKSMSELTAVSLIAKGTLQSVGDVGKVVAYGTNELGLSLEQATRRFGLLKEAQLGTGLAFSTVESAIDQSTAALKLFGDSTAGATAVYRSFVATLGDNRAGLAAELVNTVTHGLAGMSDGFRAFLGMTGQVGGGAGGAVGGMLRVEDALAKGNIEGILGDLSTTITRLSGAPLLSRDTAIATGQEQQFYMQRQILQQSLGIGDREQATKVLEMMGSGKKVQAEDIKAGAGEGLKGVVDAGQNAFNRQTTLLERANNELQAFATEALTNGRQSIMGFNDALDNVAHGITSQFGNVFRTTISDAKEKAVADESNANQTGAQLVKENRGLPLRSPTLSSLGKSGIAPVAIGASDLDEAGIAPVSIGTSDLEQQKIGMPRLTPMPALPMNQRPSLQFDSDLMRGAGQTLKGQAATPPTSAPGTNRPMAMSIEPLTISVAVNSDGSFKAYFMNEAGRQTESIIRKVSMSETDGAYSAI